MVGENIDDLNNSIRGLAITLAAMIPIVTGALVLVVWGLVGRTLEDCAVVGSRSQLGRLVRNLLENAVHHARSKVQVSMQVTSSGCRLVVIDDGPGVPAEFRKQVFERFARVDEARTSADGGCGLGLAIVKGIAERHGGQVYVEAGVADGTTLVVEL